MGLIGLLALAAVGAFIYFAIKGRAIRLREQFQEALRRAGERAGGQLPAEDMLKCPVCGTYSAPGQQKNCGKAQCPYR